MSRWTRFRCWVSSNKMSPAQYMVAASALVLFVDENWIASAAVLVIGSVVAAFLVPSSSVRLTYWSRRIEDKGGKVTITELPGAGDAA